MDELEEEKKKQEPINFDKVTEMLGALQDLGIMLDTGSEFSVFYVLKMQHNLIKKSADFLVNNEYRTNPEIMKILYSYYQQGIKIMEDIEKENK